MDRSRRRSGGLRAALVFAAGAALIAAAPPPAPPPLHALRWLAPRADPVTALTRRPAECLGAAGDAQAAYEIELGRAAFRTPLLLGGQAARAGLSCESCHRGGRNNPDFDFPGVSGAPGTADVDSATLSSHRDDGGLDPKPIPDLSGPKTALKVDQDPAHWALEADIQAIVTQEFDGPPPPAAVLEGLAAYVRALSPGACPARVYDPVTAAAALDDAGRAVRAAIAALAHGDSASALLMVEAARSQLGDLDERYAVPALAADRRTLALAAGDLATAEGAVRRDPGAGADALTLWLVRTAAWGPAVTADAGRSLYDPAHLAAATLR